MDCSRRNRLLILSDFPGNTDASAGKRGIRETQGVFRGCPVAGSVMQMAAVETEGKPEDSLKSLSDLTRSRREASDNPASAP